MKNIEVLEYLDTQYGQCSLKDIASDIDKPKDQIKAILSKFEKEEKVLKTNKSYKITTKGISYLNFYKMLEEKNTKRLSCV